MSEPSEAVYEAAARARIVARIPDITSEHAAEVLAGEYTRDVWLTEDLRDAVDAVWPLAVAEGYQRAIAELRDEDRFDAWHRTTPAARLCGASSPGTKDAADYLEDLAKERTP